MNQPRHNPLDYQSPRTPESWRGDAGWAMLTGLILGTMVSEMIWPAAVAKWGDGWHYPAVALAPAKLAALFVDRKSERHYPWALALEPAKLCVGAILIAFSGRPRYIGIGIFVSILLATILCMSI